MPLLWILPLALYLLSFILCFQHERLYWRPLFIGGLAASIVWTCFVLFGGVFVALRWQILSYSLTLFTACMVCHGELVRLKPGSRHLTSFYLMVAGGGTLGALLVTVAAPHLLQGFLGIPFRPARHGPADADRPFPRPRAARCIRAARGGLAMWVALCVSWVVSRVHARRPYLAVVEILSGASRCRPIGAGRVPVRPQGPALSRPPSQRLGGLGRALCLLDRPGRACSAITSGGWETAWRPAATSSASCGCWTCTRITRNTVFPDAWPDRTRIPVPGRRKAILARLVLRSRQRRRAGDMPSPAPARSGRNLRIGVIGLGTGTLASMAGQGDYDPLL